jgi:hypothetical protein
MGNEVTTDYRQESLHPGGYQRQGRWGRESSPVVRAVGSGGSGRVSAEPLMSKGFSMGDSASLGHQGQDAAIAPRRPLCFSGRSLQSPLTSQM